MSIAKKKKKKEKKRKKRKVILLKVGIRSKSKYTFFGGVAWIIFIKIEMR